MLLLIVDGSVVTGLVVSCTIVGMIFAFIYAMHTARISLYPSGSDEADASSNLLSKEDGVGAQNVYQKVRVVAKAISEGANAFLLREYFYMAIFSVFFSVLIILLIGLRDNWHSGIFTAIAFLTGAITSVVSGWVGMKIAVYANSRTALSAREGFGPAFVCAFKAGCVMGFALVSLAVLVLYILINLLKAYYHDVNTNPEHTTELFECITGYGLGGSSIALFGRVGGGIYTKAADVGADLCGKVEQGIPEDDPRNPAVIADNVGDNVGDIAGMGADLFGSYAESTCAALVIAAQQGHGVLVNDPNFILGQNWATLMFPLFITATGIIVSLITSFVATHLMVVKDEKGIEPSCKRQLVVSTLLMTPVVIILTQSILPASFSVSTATEVKNYYIFFCIAAGLWSGLIIGLITEYFTSNAYKPVQEVADACKTGAATNIIYGLALGYKSTIIPVFCLAFTIYISFRMAGMYGIAMAALGILSTMATALTIDAYGPICDNAGGIAEMCGMGPEIRKKTDALDAAGNTTAAIGKGFAIGSAAFVSVALFGAYSTVVGLSTVDIMRPFVFAGLLVGAMLPYWFSAMTMKSVGKAALDMVEEVRRQFQDIPGLMDGTGEPDYARCVAISTQASLREMLAPGALVLITPLVTGYGLGTEALAGLLVGTIVSGIQMAISSSNTGGAWDNAKKYIESGHLGGKGSAPHKAAVIGDTVGDPLKDTSGPSLNILIKLSAIISVVFARSFPSTGYLVQLFKG